MKENSSRRPSMRKKPVARRRAVLAGYRLVYALYRTRMKSGGFSYSLTVTVRGTGSPETAAVSDIARSRAAAAVLFDRIADARVTPCALKDVLEELL